MRPLTHSEAAQFLRMSPSTLYQRKDIPRYRRPGSRVMLFDQDELEAWLKQGRIKGIGERPDRNLGGQEQQRQGESQALLVDIPTRPVYHRNPRYR